MKAVDRCPACDGGLFQPFSFAVESERNGAMHFALVERYGLHVEQCLVYTPSLELKRPQYHFRHWYSKLAFHLRHHADEWTGRGGRLLVWCRKPAESRPATR